MNDVAKLIDAIKTPGFDEGDKRRRKSRFWRLQHRLLLHL